MTTIDQEIEFIKKEIVKRWKKERKIIKEADDLVSHFNYISFFAKMYMIEAFTAPGIHLLYEKFLEYLRKIRLLYFKRI